MSKYIDREAFKSKYLCCGYLPEMSEEEFDKFPAADVAEVVRCKDCAHGIWDDSSGLWQCVKDADYDEKAKIYCGFSAWHGAEFFCADGEEQDDAGKG